MIKKFFAFFLFSVFAVLPAIALDTIFSNADSEQFNLKPLNYTPSASKPVIAASEISTTNAVGAKTATQNLQSKNFQNAVNNLDTAQVEIREQMANYSALMAQSKTNYESKKGEYKNYKKEYNTLKRKMKKIERSKKLIQSNIYTQN